MSPVKCKISNNESMDRRRYTYHRAMKRIYKLLAAGRDVGSVLRDAKLDLNKTVR